MMIDILCRKRTMDRHYAAKRLHCPTGSVPDTSAANTGANASNTPPETRPKYKAQIHATIDDETRPTLCDTGCQRSCISENFLRRHPNLYKNNFKPHHGKTISIDGSKVVTLGSINVEFRVKGRHLRMPCRIVRNLVYDFVLGWDFFTKYDCAICPARGHFIFENEKIDFLPNTLGLSSTIFSLAEDAVVPPLSKMDTEATFYINPLDKIATTDTVEVEPLSGSFSSGRCKVHLEGG